MRASLAGAIVILVVLMVGQEAPAQTSPAPDIPPSAQAAKAEDYPTTFTIGPRLWITQGKLAYNLQGGGGRPNVGSELVFQGQNIPIYELTAELAIQRFVANLSLGYGAISGQGTMQDFDWTNDNRTCGSSPIPGTICSNTLSPRTDGHVWYVSLDMGPRLFRWKYADQVGAVDFLFGLQYWNEKYSAKGLINLNTGVTTRPTTVTALTNDVEWMSFRLGPKVSVPLFPRLQLAGSLFYVPYTYYQNDDNHNLRTDLQHPLSFRDEATGEGIHMEGSGRLTLWRSLMLEAGYRYWDMKTTGGTTTAYFSDGSASSTHLNQVNARRQGVFFSLLWTF